MSEVTHGGFDDEFIQSLRETLGTHSRLPEGLETFASGLMKRHRNAVRLHYRLGVESLPFPASPIQWYGRGFHCDDPSVRPSRTLSFARGDFFIQDAGSMLALAACQADRPGESPRLICDLCAAPGGKASALLESIGDGFLLANEPVKSRLPALEYNLARTGGDRYAVSSQDPEQLAEQLPGVFDLVLADVPCSGQALLGKGKQTLASVSSAQVEHSASRARRILAAATRLLKPGGRLVISTCTFAEAENEMQVEWLRDEWRMMPDPVDALLPYESGEGKMEGVYRLWPHRHACAGSFAASMRKQDDGGQELRSSGGPRQAKRRKRGEQAPEELNDWFRDVPPRLQVSGPVVRGWARDVPAWVERVAVGGPEWAYRTGRTWKPSHGAAIRHRLSLNLPAIELDETQAREFFAGNPITADQKGWCVVRSEGRGVGWIKASAGRGKNHLPAAARLQVS